MNRMKESYKIRTYNQELKKEQIEEVSGYIDIIEGVKFGYTNIGSSSSPNWIISDVATGLKLACSMDKLSRCPEIAKKHIQIVKDFHKKMYIKEGRKFFLELPLYMGNE